MSSIPKTAEKRIKEGIKKYKNILKKAKNMDVNESDTVTIAIDILSDICGYDKYTEITREYAIRNTFCDLAVKIDEKPVFLIEVKAIGISLNQNHYRQALQYASTQGIEWVILTNGDHWQAYKVIFDKPIKTELVFDIGIIETNNISDIFQQFFLLSKEGVKRSAIDIFHEETQLTSRYMVAAAFLSEQVLSTIRRQLRSLSNKINVTNDDILQTAINQVLKREVIEGEEAVHAKKQIASLERAKKRALAKKKCQSEADTEAETEDCQ